ncbi:MAG: nuclear transport factor 2 family protein [Chloroflexi bacterium]|nr:nuclear transport factor 2 family protein [Chloroflexota bacterium]
MTLEEMEKKLKFLEGTIQALEKRVRVTEDVQEIQELQGRYINALMCAEWDDVVDCFAENAHIDVYLHEPITGKAAIDKWFRETLSQTHAGKEGDIVVHPVISVDGDDATGRWALYMMYFYPRTGQSLFWVHGFYRMKYVRENGRWKISEMFWRERLGLPGGGPPTGLF